MSKRDEGIRIPTPEELVRAVEAVVFAAGEPVAPSEIVAAFDGVDLAEVREALEALRRRYEGDPGGLHVEQVAGGYRLATRKEVGEWVRRFFRHRNRTRLSSASLETLAIVAYRQPVTAPEIQAIRGKDPSYSLRTLLDKKMVRILGRKRVVGNPILYGTTRQFLVHFGLNSLEDLPALTDFDEFAGALEAGFGTGEGDDDRLPEEGEAANAGEAGGEGDAAQ